MFFQHVILNISRVRADRHRVILQYPDRSHHILFASKTRIYLTFVRVQWPIWCANWV